MQLDAKQAKYARIEKKRLFIVHLVVVLAMPDQDNDPLGPGRVLQHALRPLLLLLVAGVEPERPNQRFRIPPVTEKVQD